METDLAGLLRSPADYLADPDPAIRRLAVASNAPAEVLRARLERMIATDPDVHVRAAIAEALGSLGPSAASVLLEAAGDESPVVVEAIAFALGEAGDPSAVPWLLATAAGGGDKLVREAAVASLGAIGDERAVPTLLDLAAAGPPQVRRRAVVALTAYDGPDVEAAIRAAAADRNPMVREVAEMVVGPTPTKPENLLKRC